MQKKIAIILAAILFVGSASAYATASITIKGDGSNDITDFQNNGGTNVAWVDKLGNFFLKEGQNITTSSSGLIMPNSARTHAGTFTAPALLGNVTWTMPSSTSTIATLGSNTFTAYQNLGSYGLNFTTESIHEGTNIFAPIVPALVITPNSGNHYSSLSIRPSGTGLGTVIESAYNSDPSNTSLFEVGAGAIASGEDSLVSTKTGNGTTYPITFWMNAPSGTMKILTMNPNGNVGINSTSPGSTLTVKSGDIFVATKNNGVILHDTDTTNTCHRITVNSAGTISAASVTCPTS